MPSSKSLALLAMLGAGLVWGQQRQTTRGPHFAVVSIRVEPPRYRPPRRRPAPVLPGGKYFDRQAVLASLIAFAHPACVFPNKTIVGLPTWAFGGRGALFDFEAEPTSGVVPSLGEMRQMMDAALASRFQLRYHIVRRRMPVMLLEASKGGPRHIRASAAGQSRLQLNLAPTGIYGRGATMEELAERLSIIFYLEGKPVVDRTGLNGFYDIDGPPADKPAIGRLQNEEMYGLLVGSLGLKLVPGEAEVPVMIVDHVARPTPN